MWNRMKSECKLVGSSGSYSFTVLARTSEYFLAWSGNKARMSRRAWNSCSMNFSVEVSGELFLLQNMQTNTCVSARDKVSTVSNYTTKRRESDIPRHMEKQFMLQHHVTNTIAVISYGSKATTRGNTEGVLGQAPAAGKLLLGLLRRRQPPLVLEHSLLWSWEDKTTTNGDSGI